MVSLIDKNQLNFFIKNNPSWVIVNETIKREIIFNNFIEAFSFMTKVALLSEKIDHHPNWHNTYNKVTIELTTHDIGGVTANDITLAEAINKLIQK